MKISEDADRVGLFHGLGISPTSVIKFGTIMQLHMCLSENKYKIQVYGKVLDRMT